MMNTHKEQTRLATRLNNLAAKVISEFNAKFGAQMQVSAIDVMLRCRFKPLFGGFGDWEAQVGNIYVTAANPEHALVCLIRKITSMRGDR